MNTKEFRLDVMALEIAEQNTRADQSHGEATRLELAAQIHAHDPSLPQTLEEQLGELMGRPARSGEPVAVIALEALDYVESLRRVLACLPSAETLNAAVSDALGREPTTEECAAILAVIDELSRSVVQALTPRIAVESPSIMPPHEPPPPPPTKAVEAES